MKRWLSGLVVSMCLCCLLSGCQENEPQEGLLDTVYMSVCEMVENDEEYRAEFFGPKYRAIKVSQGLSEILTPSQWKRSISATTDSSYCYIQLPVAKLEFYEGNVLCVTMAESNQQEWYIGTDDVYAQLDRYIEQHGLMLPVITSDNFVAVCH